jgi:hypothetical protein
MAQREQISAYLLSRNQCSFKVRNRHAFRTPYKDSAQLSTIHAFAKNE